MFYVSPSLFAADFGDLRTELRRMADADANYIHLDVMDGTFVPNISFGATVISCLRKRCSLIFDVHLMVQEPLRFVDDFLRAGADIITVHLEACKDVKKTIRYIRSKEVRVGLAISPETPVEKIIPYLPEIDMAMVMTVHPGFGGQKFMPECLEKVRTIRRYALSHDLDLDIEVDGGLNEDNTALATEAGANVIVAGSAIFKSKHPGHVIAKMRSSAELHPYKPE